MSKLVNLIGVKIGKLRVTKRLPNKILAPDHQYTRWEADCECGNTKVVIGGEFNQRGMLSCGKCMKDLPYLFANPHYIFHWYKDNAKTRGLILELSESRLRELIRGGCHFCGYKLPIVRSDLQEFVYNGIDRVDNLLGYVEGNVVTCCKICNHAKHTMLESDFVAWILRAAQYQNKKATSTNSFSKGQAA